MAVKSFMRVLIFVFFVILSQGCNRSDLSTPDSMLISAAKNGDIKLLQLALAKGAYINTTDERGGTALHWAVYYGHKEIVKLLLMHGADPLIKDKNGITPYRLAEMKGKKEILKLLNKFREKN
ncbi:2-5A-dependent ribonuclease (2-5A-dependent RNase)(Ribonuclease L) (RNase L) (Ribonuclease 4) [Persephonella marina EX-H1]|uniref:2-5A-dependent ribonuclease (2-5A-dependent RNase)(Ribonuclease L) (RNase L) (Ribonuclease 4) n=2 Tax=Hydrogenothermaceae TaxID=224027 RepID=C0QTV4_PERMH|nr:2-5A-dependent ribonuclease (2-5A-dependent RNase)(Ribonuclease L) (RNase L) (Ribonuclease 4) [Persephonella marina EX-H1]